MTIAVGIALCILGVVLGVVLAQRLSPAPRGEQAEDARQHLLDAARTEAEQIKRDAQVESKELLLRAQETAEAELRVRREEIERESQRLGKQEAAQTRKAEILASREEEQSRRDRNIQNREQAAEQSAKRAEDIAEQAAKRLEQIAGLSVDQARAKLADEVREDARRLAAIDVKRIEEEYRLQAEERAKTIIGTAVQRYASEYVAEKTVSVVPLPSDDMKGRIIGREGRNIRALEAATGIDLIIDDTPEAVIISCFNPVRREIAKLALSRLIADGRIHPTRIEESVQKASEEIDQLCKEAGEQAAFDLGLHKMHPELLRTLGKLKFRTAGAQNLLQHSIEVGWLAGAMAAELNINVKLARRAGLLHDIGRAVDQGRHNGPFYQHGDGWDDRFSGPADGFPNQTGQRFVKSLLVASNEGGAGVVRVRQFHGGVLKRTATETRRLKPFLQSSEESPQRVFDPLAVSGYGFSEEGIHVRLPMLEDRQDEIVFAGEVSVQGRLGDVGLGDHPVDPHRPNPFGVE